MFSLPQLPDWNALHVIVVHFPIGLLMLAAPMLLFLALVFPKFSKPLAAAAGAVLLAGTVMAYVATSTGSAAAGLAKAMGALEDPGIQEALKEHGTMASKSRDYFTYLTVAFAIYLLVLAVRKQPLPAAANAAILAVFLAANGALALALGNAVHEGGELVHTYALMAPLAPGAGEAAMQAATAAGDGGAAEGEEGGEETEAPPAEEPAPQGDTTGDNPSVDYN